MIFCILRPETPGKGRFLCSTVFHNGCSTIVFHNVTLNDTISCDGYFDCNELISPTQLANAYSTVYAYIVLRSYHSQHCVGLYSSKEVVL